MVLPIYLIGNKVLEEATEPVQENSDELQQLIDDMIETMHGAAGIGLAAPQVGRTERVFVVDLTPMEEDAAAAGEELPPQPMVFINPEIVGASEDGCEFEEGCLSIPDIREYVMRPEAVRLRYLDRDFEPQELAAEGLLARVIQHEYDHLDGILFTRHLSGLRRKILRRSLRAIAQGDVETDYPVLAAADLAS